MMANDDLMLIADSAGVLVDPAWDNGETEFSVRTLIGASLAGIASLPSLAGIILAGQTIMG